jgi:hypothetical protein
MGLNDPCRSSKASLATPAHRAPDAGKFHTTAAAGDDTAGDDIAGDATPHVPE